jgi:tetratricopeptide (TPR) repeat protein
LVEKLDVNRASQIHGLWKPLIAIAVLLGAVTLLQVRIDAQTRSEAKQKEELLVTSGPLLKKLSLGYAPLLADIYWTRAVQYYGSRLGRPNVTFDLLSPLLNIAVTLDPHLIIAYRFGAIFLSMPRPGRTDLAIDLVKRGIAANPHEWRLDYDLGTLYYWRLKDYKNAAVAFLAASSLPDAPPFLRLMAGAMAEKGGSIEMSETIFAELYRSTQDRNVKKFALEQLRSLKAQQDEAQLDDLIEEYRIRFKKNPASMNELVAARLLRQNPLDPAGYPYVIGPDGKAHLYPASPINPPKQ